MAGLGLAAPAGAQEPQALAPCARQDVPSSARAYCVAAAQALLSAQPQLGLLLAGGNPTLGSVSTAGLRVRGSPGLSASGKVNFVQIRIPDVLDREAAAAGSDLAGERVVSAPALSVNLGLNLSRGVDLAPSIGGLGSVDLLGSLSWIPLRALDVSAFRLESDEFAYGLGARIGLLRESFFLPGASVSLMYRRFSEIGYGSVCAAPVTAVVNSQEGYRFSTGVCPGTGDPGEFAFDLSNFSARGVVGKQLGQLGLAFGAGYDRYRSDAGMGFRAPAGTVAGTTRYVARASGLEVANDRLSVFGNATFTTVLTTFALEAGWMEGAEPVAGFPAAGAFEPGRGILFGSVGVRLSF